MCGRFVATNVGAELIRVLRVDRVSDDLPAPSFNIAPTDDAAVMIDSLKEPATTPTRRLEPARWGLIPGWAKDARMGARAFNARSEELERKPLFRDALKKRRAVVPASGYYEWSVVDDVKVPHYVHPADDGPLLFAGLYGWWKDPARADDDPARWVLSFTILTREATGGLGSIHDRMPLFVDTAHAEAWLDPTVENVTDLRDAVIDAAPAYAATLTEHVVSGAVGNVRNDTPDLIDPVE